MVKDQQHWIAEYEKKNALWIHDGNPKRPHALLTSGKHSNGFFNSELVMEEPMFLSNAARDLVQLLDLAGLDPRETQPMRAVGPAMGAITLAHEIGFHISLEYGIPCFRAYTEKEGEGEGKRMVFKKTQTRPGEFILPVEDVLTTGGSVDLTVEAVVSRGGRPLLFVAVLVNRSGLSEVSGRKIVSLITKGMPTWEPDECPLCKEGSEAIRPKGENWARLNAQY